MRNRTTWNRVKDFILHGMPDPPPVGPHDPALRWHETGPDNRFGIRVLDCQSKTRTQVAATSDPDIAARYGTLRSSDGRDLVGAAMPDATHIAASLRFPHNGLPVPSVVFKSSSMEEKWDIYCYDSTFLFARSWTGELLFRSQAVIGPDEIHITGIECRSGDADDAASHVYFLIANHGMGVVLPHRVPRNTPADPESIAIMSFALFGNRAWYATFEDITQVPIPRSQV